VSEDIIVLTDAVLITCIVQRGMGDVVVKAAQQAGAQGATVFYAHGTGVRQRRLGVLGVTVNAEKEVVYILASTDQADRIFEKIFIAGKLDTPGMGMVYTTPIDKMATYIPHEIAERFVERAE
jgi:nitrogen regulatory protein PII